MCWLWHEKEQDFPTKMDKSLSTYLSSQSVDSRFIQSLVKKIMGKLAISEIVLFNKPSNKWKATREVVDVFKW